ncbi:hypothetical protein ScPMuIL_004543 [Solemya velum]
MKHSGYNTSHLDRVHDSRNCYNKIDKNDSQAVVSFIITAVTTGRGSISISDAHVMASAKQPTSLKIYVVDAFTDEPFSGNPAAVCPLEEKNFPEHLMKKIAIEMNLSETAFLQKLNPDDDFRTSNCFHLRWFTPTVEVALCGHATLATAAILFNEIGNASEKITFSTLSGPLTVQRSGKYITMDFPLNTPVAMVIIVYCIELTMVSLDLVKDLQFSDSTSKLLLRLSDSMTRDQFEKLSPEISQMIPSEPSGKVKGVIITLKGSANNGCVDRNGQQYDFVSRYFAPWNGIPEDPVTGSAHTVLAGYWSGVLGKEVLYARQCSARGGDVRLRVKADRVELSGEATIVLTGLLNV